MCHLIMLIPYMDKGVGDAFLLGGLKWRHYLYDVNCIISTSRRAIFHLGNSWERSSRANKEGVLQVDEWYKKIYRENNLHIIIIILHKKI